jgi:hypothetical protein
MLRYDIRTGVKKIKTKTALMMSGAGLATAGLVMATVMPLAAKAATQVVVTPSNPHGWYIQAATGGTVNYVASTGAMGNGAMEFTTNTNSDFTRFKNDINTNLNTITSLSYMTKQISAPAGSETTADVNLRLYVDRDNNGSIDDVLVYEPYYNNVQQVITTGWQTWSIDQNTGFWWSNSNLTYNGHTTTGAGGYDTNFHLSDVLFSFPNAVVKSIGLGTGDYNSPWVVQADALTVNDTTYNFEQNPNPADKDSCKNNGWKSMNDGVKTFKNQGDCVSYFATTGKNTASSH